MTFYGQLQHRGLLVGGVTPPLVYFNHLAGLPHFSNAAGSQSTMLNPRMEISPWAIDLGSGRPMHNATWLRIVQNLDKKFTWKASYLV